MYKINMILNGKTYESRNYWRDLDAFFAACPMDGEFPSYKGDGSEGGRVVYELADEEYWAEWIF